MCGEWTGHPVIVRHSMCRDLRGIRILLSPSATHYAVLYNFDSWSVSFNPVFARLKQPSYHNDTPQTPQDRKTEDRQREATGILFNLPKPILACLSPSSYFMELLLGHTCSNDLVVPSPPSCFSCLFHLFHLLYPTVLPFFPSFISPGIPSRDQNPPHLPLKLPNVLSPCHTIPEEMLPVLSFVRIAPSTR